VVLLDGRSTARAKHHRGCTTPCRPWAAIRHVSGVAGLSARRPGCGGTWRGPTHMKMAIPTEPACEHVWIHIAGPQDPGDPTDTKDIAATAAGPTVGQSLPLSTVLIERGGQWFVFITVGGMGVDPRNTWTCALASLAPEQNIRQQGVWTETRRLCCGAVHVVSARQHIFPDTCIATVRYLCYCCLPTPAIERSPYCGASKLLPLPPFLFQPVVTIYSSSAHTTHR
jgi:hypothetical protein